MEYPGAYVFGSNDYYGPKLRNPARYLLEKASGRHGLNGNAPAVGAVHNPWEGMRDAFDAAGWVGLTQHAGAASSCEAARRSPSPGSTTRTSSATATARSPAARSRTRTSRWPSYTPRTCACWTPSPPTGYPLILAGHTHGGQLCIPFYGALVTNCDLDTDRVKGLSTHRAGGHQLLPPRLRGLRHQPLHPGPLRLPPGGHAADATTRPDGT